MGSVKHVTIQNFSADVIQSDIPVLVDFYADWCGPCRMLAPTLERLATEFDGRIKIVKVNVDRESALASRYEVESIPTLVVLSNGQLIGRAAGLVGEADLRSALNQLAPPQNLESSFTR
jgi:thioredoxin